MQPPNVIGRRLTDYVHAYMQIAEGLASGEASRAIAIASAAGAATGMGDPDTDPATTGQQEQELEYHDCRSKDRIRCLLHTRTVAAITAERIALFWFAGGVCSYLVMTRVTDRLSEALAVWKLGESELG